MKSKKQKVLITGGAGFIGSNFTSKLLDSHKYEITVVDSLTYAGSLGNLGTSLEDIKFFKHDITKSAELDAIFSQIQFDFVIHFAAESHVDNSLMNPNLFIETNVNGTQNLLNSSIKHGIKKFVHISTDEVYGSIQSGSFNELSNFNPSSPYSASKASAEHLVNAAKVTFGLQTNIIRCSNNYGPRQHPEKLIPLVIHRILKNQEIPIYGDGRNCREWMYVSDTCNAIKLIMENAVDGAIYNVSTEKTFDNISIVRKILRKMDSSEKLIKFVSDRRGHDFRYAINAAKLRNELQWAPEYDIDHGLDQTIDWYINNSEVNNVPQ